MTDKELNSSFSYVEILHGILTKYTLWKKISCKVYQYFLIKFVSMYNEPILILQYSNRYIPYYFSRNHIFIITLQLSFKRLTLV